MRRAIIALSLLIILMVPFLSACDAGDLQVLVNYAKMWALVHGLTDTEGNVEAGAAARFVAKDTFLDSLGLTTTGDKEGDAVIDSARTVKDIRDAQKEANQGWNNLYSGKHIKTEVLPHYNNAINKRSQDWSYYNERGIANLVDTESPNALKDAQKDFDKASEYGNQKPHIYIQMLKQRAEATEKYVGHARDEHAGVTQELYMEQSRTYGELASLTGDSRYTQLKQQVDSYLKADFLVIHRGTK
jgi:hypothetical protein